MAFREAELFVLVESLAYQTELDTSHNTLKCVGGRGFVGSAHNLYTLTLSA